MTEVLGTLFSNMPAALIAAVVAGLIRNVAGFIENAYKDGKVDDYEIKQLVGTIVKYFSGVLLLMYGLPIDQAIVTAFGLDVVASAIKSTKTGA